MFFQLEVFLQVLPLPEANKPVKVLHSVTETVFKGLLVYHSHKHRFKFLRSQFVANRFLLGSFEFISHYLLLVL